MRFVLRAKFNFANKQCSLFFVQNPDRIQYTEHCNSCVGKYGHPHIGEAAKSQNHNSYFYDKGKYYVLYGNAVRAAGKVQFCK